MGGRGLCGDNWAVAPMRLQLWEPQGDRQAPPQQAGCSLRRSGKPTAQVGCPAWDVGSPVPLTQGPVLGRSDGTPLGDERQRRLC